jgi:hypothetical protein
MRVLKLKLFLFSFTKVDFDMDEPLFGNEENFVTTAVFDTGYDQYLVQIFPDGQARLARKATRHDSWTPGWWAIAQQQPSSLQDEI